MTASRPTPEAKLERSLHEDRGGHRSRDHALDAGPPWRGVRGGANLGSIANVRECDDLADSFFFAPEDALATLRFRLRADAEEMRLLVALSASVVTALAEHHPVTIAGGNGRNAIANVARHLPIDVDVVLGSWKVPLDELMQLRAGDQIVLPDGEDAWLAARGVRIRRASVEISASGASVEIRRSARLR